MASKNGPRTLGADGFDFEHRQKIAAQYHISAMNKSRLKSSIFAHFLLFLLMSVKLSQAILDYFDIFVMEIEELEIPKPLRWEYVWTGSVLFGFVGLSAIRRNRIGQMQLYIFGVFFSALCPVLYAAIYYFSDLWQFMSSRDSSGLDKWRNYPLAVLWYVFVAVAFQVHVFSLYFAEKLVVAWKARGSSSVSATASASVRKAQ